MNRDAAHLHIADSIHEADDTQFHTAEYVIHLESAVRVLHEEVRRLKEEVVVKLMEMGEENIMSLYMDFSKDRNEYARKTRAILDSINIDNKTI